MAIYCHRVAMGAIVRPVVGFVCFCVYFYQKTPHKAGFCVNFRKHPLRKSMSVRSKGQFWALHRRRRQAAGHHFAEAGFDDFADFRCFFAA